MPQGLWVHGVPVGPFVSQEVGSGSLFVSARVGFCYSALDSVLPSMAETNRIQFGVTTTETSVSGRFFRGFPRTRFIDPEASCLLEGNSETYKDITEKERERLMRCLLRKRLEDCEGVATPQWCLQLLQHHMHMQMHESCLVPETNTTLEVHIDRHTNGIYIPGYEYVGKKRKGASGGPPAEGVPYEVLIVCKNKQNAPEGSSRGFHRQKKQASTVNPPSALRLSAKVKFNGAGRAGPTSNADRGSLVHYTLRGSLPEYEEGQEFGQREEGISEHLPVQYAIPLPIPETGGKNIATATAASSPANSPSTTTYPDCGQSESRRHIGVLNSSRSRSHDQSRRTLLAEKEETWSWCDDDDGEQSGTSRRGNHLERRSRDMSKRSRRSKRKAQSHSQRKRNSGAAKKGTNGQPLPAKLFEDEDEVRRRPQGPECGSGKGLGVSDGFRIKHMEELRGSGDKTIKP